MTVWLWIGVAGVGGLGAVTRFLLDGAVSRRTITGFPLGTLAINVSGSTVLGFLSGLELSAHVALIVGAAAIGSYTTFSTWMFETHRLAEDSEALAAFVNLAASLALGIGGALLGRAIGVGY